MERDACGYCGTPIFNDSTLAVSNGNVYCCPNCAALDSEEGSGVTAEEECTHCGSPLVDTSTRAERDGSVFCCPNCADAEAEYSEALEEFEEEEDIGEL